MRGVRAVIPCLLIAFALPGSMRSAGAQPRSDVDAMAYAMSAPIAAAGGFSPGVSPGNTILAGKRRS